MTQAENPCPFCGKVIAGDERTPFDVPLADHGEFLVVPALGMFVPGYLLLVTRRHVPSLAHLGRSALAAVDGWRNAWLPRLAERFGEYFAFEHGMGSASDGRTGACVDHAHLHLIPSVSGAKLIADELPWDPLSGYERLGSLRGGRYSYFGHAGAHFAVSDVDLPSQWVRRRTAAALGLEHWDWAAYAGRRELAETLRHLGELGLGERSLQQAAPVALQTTDEL